MEWLSLSNGAYMLVIILGAAGTMAAVRYRPLIKEVKDVAQKYHDAKKDGSISKSEKQAIAKECMDVIVSLGRLIWKF
tara:strand:+ start:3175 stop:3408 length:234 start_codon:yes stop_codon:yes gene_type:complete